jgi:hypothetical protein
MHVAKRWTALAIAAALAVVAAYGTTAGAQDDKTPTIKEIMIKAHKGGTSLVPTIGKQLQAGRPDWDAIQAESKTLAELGVALGKNTPRKGGKESWETLTKSYNDSASALVTAAEGKDKAKATAAQRKLAASCMGCHNKHR